AAQHGSRSSACRIDRIGDLSGRVPAMRAARGKAPGAAVERGEPSIEGGRTPALKSGARSQIRRTTGCKQSVDLMEGAMSDTVNEFRRKANGQVVLVLQGGGALGAYQVGVYEALHEAGVEPDWIIGTSIGAINASIIAGNKPQDRLTMLNEFWNMVERP